MKITLLYLAMATMITTIGCQRKIQKANIIQTKTNSSIITKTKVDTLEKIESKLKVEGIALSIEPKRFKNSTMGKAKIVITNNTKEHILAGEIYYVDFKEENTWKRLNINDGVIFDLIGIDINAFTTRELEINFKVTPYNFKPGKYRISKEVTQTSKKKEILISTEFIVE